MDTHLAEIAKLCIARDLTICTVESCTAGMLAAALTEPPGSSQYYEGGFVTYRLSAKHHLLGISTEILDQQGAVSEQVATLMAEAAQKQTGSDISLAVTGLAGPEGDGSSAQVGTLWLTWLWPDQAGRRHLDSKCFNLEGSREAFRSQAVELSLAGLQERLLASDE